MISARIQSTVLAAYAGSFLFAPIFVGFLLDIPHAAEVGRKRLDTTMPENHRQFIYSEKVSAEYIDHLPSSPSAFPFAGLRNAVLILRFATVVG